MSSVDVGLVAPRSPALPEVELGGRLGAVTVDHADLIDDVWRDRSPCHDAIAPHVQDRWVDEGASTHDVRMTDRGTEIGFARVVATTR